MADNVDITAGSGTKVATDQVPGTLEHIQVVKLADGTADSAARIPGDATAGLKVNLGADNDVTVTSGTITTITNVVHVDDNASTLSVDDGAGSLTVDGTVTAIGGAADDVAITGNPVPVGFRATNTTRTAVSNADAVYPIATLQGEQVVTPCVPELKGAQKTTITSSTSETTIITADATYKLELYGFIIANTSSTFTKVTVKDATAGTTRMILSCPAQDTRGFMLPPGAGHVQATVNNNWTATCGTSVADVEITALYVKKL